MGAGADAPLFHRPGAHAASPASLAWRAIARAHHEHLDGSGYPLGLCGAALGRPERLLAAAVAYQSALEPRPYRERAPGRRGGGAARERVASGALDATSVEAVLAVAGHAADAAAPRRRAHAARDRDPRLVARGFQPEIAARLVLSEKTVRNHVERTYAKIGATNRVGASLYALEHGLVAPVEGRQGPPTDD